MTRWLQQGTETAGARRVGVQPRTPRVCVCGSDQPTAPGGHGVKVESVVVATKSEDRVTAGRYFNNAIASCPVSAERY